MKKPSLPPGLRQQPVDNFIAGGGEVAAEKAAKPTTGKKLRKSDSAVVAYTLRIATSKLDDLAAIREARIAEQPDRTISVHSLLLEAVDEYLKREGKKAVKRDVAAGVKKKSS
jgi:hypothetical protein